MRTSRDVLRAGEPVNLPSGGSWLLVTRTRTLVGGTGRWRTALVRHDPHAVLLQQADGCLRALAAGSDAVSLVTLSTSLPHWAHVLERLRRSAADAGRPPPARER